MRRCPAGTRRVRRSRARSRIPAMTGHRLWRARTDDDRLRHRGRLATRRGNDWHMLTQRKRPTNAELLELARIQDELDAPYEVADGARRERQDAERVVEKVQAAELKDWMRAMRESGRAHEIHKGMPVEPRSAERVQAEQALAQAKAREKEARQRAGKRDGETWEFINTFRHLTGGDQRRLIRLRGWPTERYMRAARQDPENRSGPRWNDDDVIAWEAARAKGGPT